MFTRKENITNAGTQIRFIIMAMILQVAVSAGLWAQLPVECQRDAIWDNFDQVQLDQTYNHRFYGNNNVDIGIIFRARAFSDGSPLRRYQIDITDVYSIDGTIIFDYGGGFEIMRQLLTECRNIFNVSSSRYYLAVKSSKCIAPSLIQFPLPDCNATACMNVFLEIENQSGTDAIVWRQSNPYGTCDPACLPELGNVLAGLIVGTQLGEVTSSAGCDPTCYWTLWGNDNVNSNLNFIGPTNEADLVLKTNNLERMRITSGGNVGIGINNPVDKFQVNTHDWYGENASIVLSTDHPDDYTQSRGNAAIRLYRPAWDGAPGTSHSWWIENSQTAWNNGALRFRTSDIGYPIGAEEPVLQNIMVLMRNGRVGVGIDPPTARFSVKASSTISEKAFNVLSSADLPMFSVLNNGNAGVGIDPPTARFSIKASSTTSEKVFDIVNYSSTAAFLTVLGSGNVGIGVANPSTKLAVDGTICAKEVRVALSGEPCWPDYVFGENYKLSPLNEVERFIKANKHLPDVPSAAEVSANGVELGNMQALLLKKIEELTLHLIELKKENEEIKKMMKEK